MATLKQKKAVEKIVENRGNISRAMLEAGYRKGFVVARFLIAKS